ncbi:DNA-binding transcriptional LysR family regulator [Bradyrhizobium sp. F1.13.1]
MTLEQLRIFAAVADRQHVTQAARELNLTQSATSAAIAALEGRYGVKLFDRVGRGIVLTHMGRSFLGEARAVLARAHAAEQVLRDFAGLKAGRLVIAASQTVGSYWLPARLLAFQVVYPGIELDVKIANTEHVATDVREGMADLGFIEGDIDDAALSARRLDGDALVAVVGPQHPLANQRKLPPRLDCDDTVDPSREGVRNACHVRTGPEEARSTPFRPQGAARARFERGHTNGGRERPLRRGHLRFGGRKRDRGKAVVPVGRRNGETFVLRFAPQGAACEQGRSRADVQHHSGPCCVGRPAPAGRTSIPLQHLN